MVQVFPMEPEVRHNQERMNTLDISSVLQSLVHLGIITRNSQGEFERNPGQLNPVQLQETDKIMKKWMEQTGESSHNKDRLASFQRDIIGYALHAANTIPSKKAEMQEYITQLPPTHVNHANVNHAHMNPGSNMGATSATREAKKGLMDLKAITQEMMQLRLISHSLAGMTVRVIPRDRDEKKIQSFLVSTMLALEEDGVYQIGNNDPVFDPAKVEDFEENLISYIIKANNRPEQDMVDVSQPEAVMNEPSSSVAEEPVQVEEKHTEAEIIDADETVTVLSENEAPPITTIIPLAADAPRDIESIDLLSISMASLEQISSDLMERDATRDLNEGMPRSRIKAVREYTKALMVEMKHPAVKTNIFGQKKVSTYAWRSFYHKMTDVLAQDNGPYSHLAISGRQLVAAPLPVKSRVKPIIIKPKSQKPQGFFGKVVSLLPGSAMIKRAAVVAAAFMTLTATRIGNSTAAPESNSVKNTEAKAAIFTNATTITSALSVEADATKITPVETQEIAPDAKPIITLASNQAPTPALGTEVNEDSFYYSENTSKITEIAQTAVIKPVIKKPHITMAVVSIVEPTLQANIDSLTAKQPVIAHADETKLDSGMVTKTAKLLPVPYAAPKIAPDLEKILPDLSKIMRELTMKQVSPVKLVLPVLQPDSLQKTAPVTPTVQPL